MDKLEVLDAAEEDFDAVSFLMSDWYARNNLPCADIFKGSWLVCKHKQRVVSCVVTEKLEGVICILGIFSESTRWGKLGGDAIMNYISRIADDSNVQLFGVTISPIIALFCKRYGWTIAGIALIRPVGGA